MDDLVCLDEIQYLLRGRQGRTYAHIVIDEAQDLTPMQARSLARRCPSGSMTVLGDLAQATGPHRYQSWNTLAGCLSGRDGWRLAELLTGFRIPSEVMDFARSLGTACASGVAIPASVRATGSNVQLRRTSEPVIDAVDHVRSLQREAADSGRSAVVIVPDGSSWQRSVRIQLQQGAEEQQLEDDAANPGDGLTVMAASECKGLEFDHVIVVEPAAIAAGDDAGLNQLYVALTRCTQSLTIYHRAPLPAALSGEGTLTPLPSEVFPIAKATSTAGSVERRCSRFHLDGTRCTNSTTDPDGWCRQAECAGYRTNQPSAVPGKPAWLKPPVGGDPDARLSLSEPQRARLRVSATAQQEFQRLHGGSPQEAAVELHAMVAAMLAEGTHYRAANQYWYLDHLGYRLILSPEADAVTNYRSAHLERSYAQVQVGIPSRIGKDARAQRRSALTPKREDRGERLPQADASTYARADVIHVTASACASFERIHPETRDLSDEDFVLTLLAAYADNLGSGTALLHDERHLLVGTELSWNISADGRALIGVRPRTAANLSPDSTAQLTATSMDEKTVPTAPAAAPVDLHKFILDKVHEARQDKAHEALRHRLLADLYDNAAEVGADDLADAWSTSSSERVVYEVLVPGANLYASIREAALQVMEVDYLRDGEKADHLVLVLPTAPVESWVEDAVAQAFSIELLWREGGAWAGQGAKFVAPA